MFFKTLTQVLPIEIANEICDYDNTYKLRMNNVINQIKKINKAVEEYWDMDEILYYMTENEELHRLNLGLRVSPLDWPLPDKKCFRFWNTEATPTLEVLTHPRDNWWFYQYDDGCYMYPTSMTNFFKK
jgi:hypothetical protein